MKTLRFSAALLAIGFLLLNCGGKKEESPKTGLEALENIADEAEKLSKEGSKDVIDAKLLEGLLPTDANGIPRQEVSSEKTGAMGFQVATAEGIYREGDSSIEVDIVDVAATGAIMGMAAWAMVDVKKETESGYEKTITYKGHKAFEKYDTTNKEGEMAVLVASRFVVSIKGSNVDMSKIKATLDGIDLRKLADLK